MIIAVILGILSVLVIIFTAIYLNKENKIKRNIQKRKGKKKLNNLWGIDDIRNEVIVSNNKKTIIMRIGSIDYHLLSAKEQNARLQCAHRSEVRAHRLHQGKYRSAHPHH